MCIYGMSSIQMSRLQFISEMKRTYVRCFTLFSLLFRCHFPRICEYHCVLCLLYTQEPTQTQTHIHILFDGIYWIGFTVNFNASMAASNVQTAKKTLNFSRQTYNISAAHLDRMFMFHCVYNSAEQFRKLVWYTHGANVCTWIWSHTIVYTEMDINCALASFGLSLPLVCLCV